MPMNQGVLEQAAKAAMFAALQDAFLDESPPEHHAQVTEQNEKMATAFARGIAEVVPHIQQFAQSTGTVATVVSTVVATAGSAAVQAGTGTGSGTGTATVAPGGIT